MAYNNKKYNYSEGISAEDSALVQYTEMLIKQIEELEKSNWQKPWVRPSGSCGYNMPVNISGREYNGMNALMLLMLCAEKKYQYPIFATFDRINAFNYDKNRVRLNDGFGNDLPYVCVNKGEKSFPVFITTFTVINTNTGEKISYDDYKGMDNEDRKDYRVYPKLQVYKVFNIDQTNLKETRPDAYKNIVEGRKDNMPKTELTDEGMFTFPAMDDMIKTQGWICPIYPKAGDDAYYSISKNEIVVPEKKQFKSGESFYCNLAHEMAHSTGAESVLNRLKPAAFGSSEYAREELVAELTASLTAQRYGMEKYIKEDSIPYLKSWLGSLKESPQFIKTILLDVKRAYQIIIEHIETIK